MKKPVLQDLMLNTSIASLPTQDFMDIQFSRIRRTPCACFYHHETALRTIKCLRASSYRCTLEPYITAGEWKLWRVCWLHQSMLAVPPPQLSALGVSTRAPLGAMVTSSSYAQSTSCRQTLVEVAPVLISLMAWLRYPNWVKVLQPGCEFHFTLLATALSSNF